MHRRFKKPRMNPRVLVKKRTEWKTRKQNDELENSK